MNEEVEGLIKRAKNSSDKAGVGEGEGATAAAGRHGGESAKLHQLVRDLQQQLGQQHQDVRRWLGGKDLPVTHGIDADDGVIGKIDFLVAMLMAVRSEGFDTPRQACVLPPWKFAEAHGLSEDEQTPEVWLRRLKEWIEDDCKAGKGYFKKKKRLFLLCAHTHRLVPCGPNGQGYDIEQPRTWFRMSVSAATFALQVVCSTLAAMAVAPVSGAGAAVEATVTTAMGSFESALQDQLAALTINDDGAAMDIEPQTVEPKVRARSVRCLSVQKGYVSSCGRLLSSSLPSCSRSTMLFLICYTVRAQILCVWRKNAEAECRKFPPSSSVIQPT